MDEGVIITCECRPSVINFSLSLSFFIYAMGVTRDSICSTCRDNSRVEYAKIPSISVVVSCHRWLGVLVALSQFPRRPGVHARGQEVQGPSYTRGPFTCRPRLPSAVLRCLLLGEKGHYCGHIGFSLVLESARRLPGERC